MKELFSETSINITVSGAKHMGVVIGSLTFKKDYIKPKKILMFHEMRGRQNSSPGRRQVITF